MFSRKSQNVLNCHPNASKVPFSAMDLQTLETRTLYTGSGFDEPAPLLTTNSSDAGAVHQSLLSTTGLGQESTHSLSKKAKKRADLVPVRPKKWSDAIVVSSTDGSRRDSIVTDGDDIFANWAITNQGKATTGAFRTRLFIDGQAIGTWKTSSLKAWQLATASIKIGKLSAGTHTITLVTDARGQVAESSETNNTYTRTITVQSGQDWFSTHLLDPELIALGRQLDADGSFSRNDMIKLFRSAEDDGLVDASEFADLQTITSNASMLGIADYVQILSSDVVFGNAANLFYQGQYLGDLYAGASADQLEMLVGKWFLGSDHPDSGGYSYESFDGNLFVNGPQDNDSSQGYLGDCYFIAAMDALAKSNPQAVKNMFIDNGDGTFTVRFYTNGVADYVTVDRSLPVSWDSPVFASTGADASYAGNELWMALLEKAYVQFNETGKTDRSDASNSYSAIEGGWMFDVNATVLGHASQTYWWFDPNYKSILINAINQNGAITLGSFGDAPDVVGSHAYELVGYDSRTDTFILRNPWGYNDPAPLSYAQLATNFECFTVA